MRLFILVLATLWVFPIAATAQSSVSVGVPRQDTSLPVEVTSESLTVEDEEGVAIFEGNVVVVQGTMRLTAPWIRVDYVESEEGRTVITEMNAKDGVTYVNGPEAAESEKATYWPEDGDLVMTGDVMLTQGKRIMEGERLTVDLALGTGVMEGGVRTVFQQDGGN